MANQKNTFQKDFREELEQDLGRTKMTDEDYEKVVFPSVVFDLYLDDYNRGEQDSQDLLPEYFDDFLNEIF